MKNIRTALTDAGFTATQVHDEKLRYTNTSGYTVNLLYRDPKTLDLLRVDKIETSSPGNTDIDFSALKPTDKKQKISQLFLLNNNQLTLTSGSLNVDTLTLRNSILQGITTEQKLGHFSIDNSTMAHVSILGLSNQHSAVFVDESDLHNVRINHVGINFYRVACYGDEKRPKDFNLVQSLRYVEHFMPREDGDRQTSLHVLANAPAGCTTNLAGQRIYYKTYLTEKGEIYLKLGCWSGTLTEAQTLIEKKAQKWPSYDEAEGNFNVKTARKRYRALFKHIEQSFKHIEQSMGALSIEQSMGALRIPHGLMNEK